MYVVLLINQVPPVISGCSVEVPVAELGKLVNKILKKMMVMNVKTLTG